MTNITTVSGTITIEARKSNALQLLTYLRDAYSCKYGVIDYATIVFLNDIQFKETSKTQFKITVPFEASGKDIYTNNLEWFKTDLKAPISDKHTYSYEDLLAQTALNVFKKERGSATIKFDYSEYAPNWDGVMTQGNTEFVFQAGKLVNVTISTSDVKATAHNLIETGLFKEPVDTADYETIVNILATEYFDSSELTDAQKQKLIDRLKPLTTRSVFVEHEDLAVAIKVATERSLLELEAEIR